MNAISPVIARVQESRERRSLLIQIIDAESGEAYGLFELSPSDVRTLLTHLQEFHLKHAPIPEGQQPS
jgi:hypothetical protein